MNMWYLYLDESGDLGFDFISKRPSKFFTVAITAVSSIEANRRLAKEARLILRRKLNPRGKRARRVLELKGGSTTLEIKKYFYDRVRTIKFGIYAITLNKKRVYEQLAKDKSHVYNYVTRRVLDQIPFEMNEWQRVQLIIDRSKGKPEIEDFNSYIAQQLKGRLNPKTPLDIYHLRSHDTAPHETSHANDLFVGNASAFWIRRNGMPRM